MAFWDIFNTDLSQQPPDMNCFPELVKDIRLAIERILPQKKKNTTSRTRYGITS